jgi:hypothetical protein
MVVAREEAGLGELGEMIRGSEPFACRGTGL